MGPIFSNTRISNLTITLIAGALAVNAGLTIAADTKVTLSGANETPPVTTSASGAGTITVSEDRSVAGSVTTKGIDSTAAHIHLAAEGQSGPPIITLTKTSDNEWSVPSGAKLTDDQYSSYVAGKLYVNVHSAEHAGGEIRGQLTP